MRWYGILGGLRPPRPPAGGAAPPRTPLHILRGLRPLKLPLRVFGRAGSQNPIPSILTNAFRSKLVTRDIAIWPEIRKSTKFIKHKYLNTYLDLEKNMFC